MYHNNITHDIVSVEDRQLWSLEEVKNYLRVSHNSDDRLISNLIYVTTIYAEQFLGTRILTTKVVCNINKAPDFLRLKYRPIIIDKVHHIVGERNRGGDRENRQENMEDITGDFGYVSRDEERIYISPRYWQKKLQIDYDAGFGDEIPKPILQGILMHIGMIYDFGENSVNFLSEIKEIYLPYRYLKI